MSTLYLTWDLIRVSPELIKRYCRQCGRVVGFKDTLKRRQNANGKNIYEYAIFKCERDHTWNKKLRAIKAFPGIKNSTMEYSPMAEENQEIEYEKVVAKGADSAHILIQQVENRWRLDVVLSSKIRGLSRSRIQKWIKKGIIQVNSLHVSPNYFLCTGDIITILFGETVVTNS
jgi:hypothetical protein